MDTHVPSFGVRHIRVSTPNGVLVGWMKSSGVTVRFDLYAPNNQYMGVMTHVSGVLGAVFAITDAYGTEPARVAIASDILQL